MKIAIAGKMGSGKSHIADMIFQKFGFKKTSFAKRVKELATELFGMVDKDRDLLIKFATKMRDIDSYVWIGCVLKFCKENESDDIVLDDLRLENEYQTLKKSDWFLVKLDIDKETRQTRLKSKYGDDYESHRQHFDSITENDVISKEDSCFDFTVRNDNDIDILMKFIDVKQKKESSEKNKLRIMNYS